MKWSERDTKLARVEALGDEIATLSAEIQAATARFLRLVGEFDELGGWHEACCKSCAHWVSWRCGIELGAAREYVRVARRLPDMPLIRSAFEHGELSYSKVRAVTRMQHLEEEEKMLRLARGATASQLERMVRAYRGVVAVQFGEARDDRFLSVTADDDGSFRISGRLNADEGALLQATIQRVKDELYKEVEPALAPPGEDSANPGDHQAPAAIDALLRMAENYRPRGAKDAPTIPDQYQVMIHIDQEALVSGQGVGTLNDGTPVPMETVGRLCCDAAVIVASHRNGRLVKMGRKTRRIPPALRRALRRRDGDCCVFPGCCQQRIDGHHVDWWIQGGKTDIDDIAGLCRFHHTRCHAGRFTMRNAGRGVFTFHRPDGTQIHPAPRPPRRTCNDLLAGNRSRGVETCPSTSSSAYAGERLDLPYAVDVLFDWAPHPDDPRRTGDRPDAVVTSATTSAIASRLPAAPTRAVDVDDADPYGYGRIE